MNTIACFVFLLAIGLSAQKSVPLEFHVDFDNMVGAVLLEDNKTLLDCSEKCDEVKEAACKCVHFHDCKNGTVNNCIFTGLKRLNFTSLNETQQFLDRLEHDFNGLIIPNEDTHQWSKLVSPRHFLNYILEVYQKLNAQKSG